MITFPCPKCQATLKAPEDKIGARTNCPQCRCPVQVPGRPVSNPPRDEGVPVVTEALPCDVPVPKRRPDKSPRIPRAQKRRDEQDYGHENDRPRKQGGTSVLTIMLGVAGGFALISCLGIGGCIALIGLGTKGVAEKLKQEWPADNVSNTERIGDVSIQCLQARSDTFSGKDWGEWKMYGPLLVIELKLTNTSRTKIVEFKGWQNAKSIVEDEHGNRYDLVNFGVGFGGFGDGLWTKRGGDQSVDTAAIIARNLNLHPGKSYITYLFCRKPADVSKEARLTLPANALGGTGTVRLRMTITDALAERRQR